MKAVCELHQCAGCMACVEICPKEAIMIKDTLSSYNAVIDENKCVNCNACHKVCQQNHTPEQKEPVKWYQGWASDIKIRGNCSSGGVATAVSLAFVKSGAPVYSCCFENGEFRFKKAVTEDEVKQFTGSKYVKSNPIGCYKEIRDDLKKDNRVLFIGLPCQVAALKNYVGDKLGINLYTADLICHGTPSPKLLDVFLKQYNKNLKSSGSMIFRIKAKMQIQVDCKSIVTKGVSDRYTIAFLNGLTYTENCYDCRYADKKRVSDITLGDSWGSELSLEDKKDGISLVLCQTEKGLEILENADVELRDVNLEIAVSNNQQLDHPSRMPECRSAFFHSIKAGKNFNREVKRYFPKPCFKQDVKELLIRMRIKKA